MLSSGAPHSKNLFMSQQTEQLAFYGNSTGTAPSYSITNSTREQEERVDQ